MNREASAKLPRPTLLSTLWIFASLNYIYCDLVSMMDSETLTGYLKGEVNGISMTPGFLLGATVLVEIPMAMVLLSRILPDRPNRITNLVAGTIMTLVQVGTLFMGSPAPAYLLSSVVEIATTVAVVWVAWRWTVAASPHPAMS